MARRAVTLLFLCQLSPQHAYGPGAATRRTVLERTSAGAALGLLGAAGAPPLAARAIGTLPEFASLDRVPSHLSLNVEDLDACLTFMETGLKMKKLREASGPEYDSVFLGYGPAPYSKPPGFLPGVSSFDDYGAHFALELRAPKKEGAPLRVGNGLQYIQLALPNVRISKLLAAGGNITEAYGNINVLAPGCDVPFRIIIGEIRDPFMFAALRVRDAAAAAQFYQSEPVAMSPQPYPVARPFAPPGPFEPEQPPGSVYLAHSNDTFGMLLVPTAQPAKGFFSKAPPPEALDVGNVFGGLTIASAREVAADAPLLRDADGYAAAVLSPYETVAKTLSIGGKGSRLPAGLGA